MFVLQDATRKWLMASTHAMVCMTSILYHTTYHGLVRKVDICIVHIAAIVQLIIALLLPLQIQSSVSWPYYLAVAYTVAMYYLGLCQNIWVHATIHIAAILGNKSVLRGLEVLHYTDTL